MRSLQILQPCLRIPERRKTPKARLGPTCSACSMRMSMREVQTTVMGITILKSMAAGTRAKAGSSGILAPFGALLTKKKILLKLEHLLDLR